MKFCKGLGLSPGPFKLDLRAKAKAIKSADTIRLVRIELEMFKPPMEKIVSAEIEICKPADMSGSRLNNNLTHGKDAHKDNHSP